MDHQYNRVRGLVVMIVACQVMDPGSIPGERIFVFVTNPQTETYFENGFIRCKQKSMTSEGIEPPIFGSGIRRVAIAP